MIDGLENSPLYGETNILKYSATRDESLGRVIKRKSKITKSQVEHPSVRIRAQHNTPLQPASNQAGLPPPRGPGAYLVERVVMVVRMAYGLQVRVEPGQLVGVTRGQAVHEVLGVAQVGQTLHRRVVLARMVPPGQLVLHHGLQAHRVAAVAPRVEGAVAGVWRQ